MAGCISWRNDPSRRCITKRKLCNFWKSRFAYATLKIIFAIWLLASVCSQYIRLCLVGDSVCSTFSEEVFKSMIATFQLLSFSFG